MPSIFSFSLPDDHPMIPILSKMKKRSMYLRKAISNDARWRQQHATAKRIHSWLVNVGNNCHCDGGTHVPPFEWFVVDLDELTYQTEDVASE